MLQHPNVHNEINMEKWALKKLKHPGIVSLYSTFQDYYCLYFVLEHCTGGELWDKLSYKGFMVWSFAELFVDLLVCYFYSAIFADTS